MKGVKLQNNKFCTQFLKMKKKIKENLIQLKSRTARIYMTSLQRCSDIFQVDFELRLNGFTWLNILEEISIFFFENLNGLFYEMVLMEITFPVK